ncbi:hypothetical protein L9F63_011455 [Diploptera punctata]|uniref:Uncharacterized protein n=1 Tax=Diploptera punctata TaxID=6984 RepID=A0AAD8EPW7_DIPPU|nr:hypothetical protein L9F63_011455 [Diploptera punctata]
MGRLILILSSLSTVYKHDLILLAIIIAIKFKAVIVILAAIFWFGTYSKVYEGIGGYYKSLKCPPPVIYESPHKHHDWSGHSDHRRDFHADHSVYSEHLDLELLSSVMKG